MNFGHFLFTFTKNNGNRKWESLIFLHIKKECLTLFLCIFLFHFNQLNLKIQLFSSHLMVGIKRDIGLVFCGNFYRERLVVLVLQINLLSDLYFLCSRKLCDRNGENCVRIRQMNSSGSPRS